MKKLLFPLLALIIAAGCEDDKDSVEPLNSSKQEIKLVAGISQMQVANKSVVEGQTFNEGTEIGLYAIQAPASGDIWTGTPEYSNDGTAKISSGKISVADKDDIAKTFYYPANDQTIQFFGWYPTGTFTAAVSSVAPTVKFDLSVTDQPDIMYATATSEKLSIHTANNLPLNFNHKLAKIGFKVKAGTGFAPTGISVTSVKIAGLKTSATMNIATGELSFTEIVGSTEITQSINEITIGSSESKIFGITLLEPGATYNLTVTAGGVDYTLNGLIAPAEGKAQNIVLTFNATAMEPTATITPWDKLDDDKKDISK